MYELEIFLHNFELNIFDCMSIFPSMFSKNNHNSQHAVPKLEEGISLTKHSLCDDSQCAEIKI